MSSRVFSGNGTTVTLTLDHDYPDVAGSTAYVHSTAFSGTFTLLTVNGNVVTFASTQTTGTVVGGTLSPFSWGEGIEVNGPRNVTVRNGVIYTCRGNAFNLNGNNPALVAPATGPADDWTFDRITVDYRTSFISSPPWSGQYVIGATGMTNSTWSNCTFYLNGLVQAVLLGNCQNNDFSGITIIGSPPSGKKFFYQDSYCSGNTPPAGYTWSQ